MIGAGRLRHRATFLRRDVTADAYGNVKGDYAPLFSAWSNLMEQTGRERIVAGSVENIRRGTMRVRTSTNTRSLTEADRVTCRGETWKIIGIANADERGSMLDLLLEAGGT